VTSKKEGDEKEALRHLKAAVEKEPGFVDFVPAQMIAASIALYDPKIAKDEVVKRLVFEGNHPEDMLDQWQVVRLLVAYEAGDKRTVIRFRPIKPKLEQVTLKNGWSPEFVKAALVLREDLRNEGADKVIRKQKKEIQVKEPKGENGWRTTTLGATPSSSAATATVSESGMKKEKKSEPKNEKAAAKK
jgi:hypothetical protein